MELSLTKEQRLVAHAAATNDDRLVLTSVCVRGNRLIATDGFMLAETELDNNSKPVETDVLIPASDLIKAKDMRSTGRVFVTKNDTNEVKIMENDSTRIVLEIQGNFPNTDPLYPTTEHVFRIALSYEVLSKILKVSGKGNYAKLTFYGQSDSFKYEVPNTNIKGLAMPLSVKWED